MTIYIKLCYNIILMIWYVHFFALVMRQRAALSSPTQHVMTRKTIESVYVFFFLFKLYLAYGRDNLVLRHSDLHVPPCIWDIARCVSELNAAFVLLLERRNNNNSFPWVIDWRMECLNIRFPLPTLLGTVRDTAWS